MRAFFTNKKNLKTLCSFFVILSLVFGVLNVNGVSAIAATADPQDVPGSAQTAGYAVLNADGSINHKVGNPTVESADHAVKASKTIVANANGGFDVTLTAETSQTVTQPGSAVVLVLDFSSSMDDQFNNLKNAVASFVTTLPAETQVAVVAYGNGATTLTSWKAAKNYTASEVKNYSNKGNSILGGYNGNGTNTDSGIRLANNLLYNTASPVYSYANKSTVLFTDGLPTFAINAKKSYTNSMSAVYQNNSNNLIGSGNDNDASDVEACTKALESSVNTLKNNGSNIYTILFGNTNQVCYKKDGKVDRYALYSGSGVPSTYAFKVDNACPNPPSHPSSKSDVSTVSSVFGATCHNCWSAVKKHKTVYYVTEKVNGKVNYTLGELLEDISTNGKVSKASASDLKSIFDAMANVVTNGSTGNGWTVTDPMGQFIVYSDNNGIALEENTLKWVLSEDYLTKTAGVAGKTTYTYAYTYHVDLDVTAAAFVDNKEYPVNGVTTLTYDGKSLDFIVPVVKGTAPQFAYTVNYLKKSKTTGNYETAEASVQGPARLNETVYAPAGYVAKYDNYTLNSTLSNASAVITGSGQTINLYYDPDTTSATVTYKYTTIGNDGSTETSSTVTDTDTVNGLYVGEAYTFTPAETRTFGGATYSLVADSNDNVTSIESLNADASQNNLVVCYQRDARAAANVTLTKTYTNHSYELDESGRFVARDFNTSSDPETLVRSSASASYTIPTVEAAEGYTFVGLTFNGVAVTAGQVVALQPDTNALVASFEKTTDMPATVDVTVNHNYEYTEYYIDDDGILTNRQVTGFVTETVSTYRVGETITVNPATEYNGKTYTASDNNCYERTVEEDLVINLYYVKEAEYPETTTITFKHIFQTITNSLVEVKDENGVVIGTTIESNTVIDKVDTYTRPYDDEVIYVGQKIETMFAVLPGYDEGEVEPSYRANGQTVEIYYTRTNDVDVRDDASVKLLIRYEKQGKEIVNGEVVEFTGRYVDTISDTYNKVGKAGDKYELPENYIEFYTSRAEDNFEYVFDRTRSDALTIDVLQAGTNVINLVYVADVEDSELTPVTLGVTKQYSELVMYINSEGKAVYPKNGTLKNVTFNEGIEPNCNKYYVGQKIRVLDGATEEYNISDSANPGVAVTGADGKQYYEITLDAAHNGRSYLFTYIKKTPLPTANVSVQNHYSVIEVGVDGTRHEPVSTEGEIVNKTYYVGEKVTVKGTLIDGFTPENILGVSVNRHELERISTAERTLVVDEKGAEVVFFYVREDNNSVPVNYTVAYNYKTIDWDGEVSNEMNSLGVDYSTFQTKPIDITVDTVNGEYEFVNYTINPETTVMTVSGSVISTVADKDFTITIYCEKHIDTRESATIKYVHHYSSFDTYKNVTENDGEFVESFTGTLENGWCDGKIYVGRELQREDIVERTSYNGNSYTVSEIRLTLNDAIIEKENVIDIYYTRSYASLVPGPVVIVVLPTKYTVTFRDFDDTVLSQESVVKGNPATAPAAPTRADDEAMTYTFTGWDKDFSYITEDTTVYATYKAEEIILDVPEEFVPQGDDEEEPEEAEMPEPEMEEPEEVIETDVIETPQADAEDTIPQLGTTPILVFYGLGAACIIFGGVLMVKVRRKED